MTKQAIHRQPAVKRMLQGAAIGLVFISVFLSTIDDPDPAWPKYWMVRPFLMVPLATAFGGLFYYFMDYYRQRGLGLRIAADIISILAFIISLWMGSVIGLDGTLWN